MSYFSELMAYCLSTIVVYSFNLSIQIGFMPESEVERIIFDILKSRLFLISEVLDSLEKAGSDKSEINKVLVSFKTLVTEESRKICDKIIWNEKLSEKIWAKILKEYFRKVNFELGCRGFSMLTTV